MTASKPANGTNGEALESRPYQQRIIEKTVRAFLGAHSVEDGRHGPEADSVLIESPTGSGKTVMGLAIAQQLQAKRQFTVGWVAMRRNLLTQARRENELRGFRIPMEFISMFDKHPPAVDLLIVDEAQHDASYSMAELHCKIKPKKILGLSATPFRTDRLSLSFDKVVKDAGIHRLIHEGYLSPYHHFTIDEHTPVSIAELFASDPGRWGQSVIFFHRQHQCEACCHELTERGIRAEVVTAQTDRERQIEDLTAGRLQVLVNVAILTEGFDCPPLKTVFCRPSGKLTTIQMAGRVLRKHKRLPYKQIVQCRHTRHPFIRTAQAAEQYVRVSSRWESLTLNRRIESISQRVRLSLAQSHVQLPEVVAAHCHSPLLWERNNEPV